MKTRDGFVSNSSSASYIINIKNITTDDFCEKVYAEYSYDILQDFENIFTRHSIIIEECLATMADYKSEETVATNIGLKEPLLSNRIERLKDINKQIKLAEDSDDVKGRVLTFLKIHNINILEKDNKIQLSYSTTMHNNYISGMESWLQEIILHFLFSRYEINAEKLDDR